MTNPVLVVDDLDDAAMLVLHWGRGHWLFWLHWLCCFLLQLLLRDNTNTKHFDKWHTASFLQFMTQLHIWYVFYRKYFTVYFLRVKGRNVSMVCMCRICYLYLFLYGKQMHLPCAELIPASDI